MFISALLLATLAGKADTPLYKDPHAPVEARVRDLLRRMTLTEKLNQLRADGDPRVYEKPLETTGFGFFTVAAIRGLPPVQLAEALNDLQKKAMMSRLKIPIMPYEESLHGLINPGHVSFPQAIGLAATWDPAFIHSCATAIAEEDRAQGIRQVLSPVINVVRDARWGRVEESYGEDPLITSKIGVAFVSALESHGVVTTPKHYVANVWDGGRDSHAVEISERSLREIYLAPFEALFKEGGSRSVMCSYNAVNGIPCADSHWLLTDILRGEWGFQGYVVSDWGAADNVWRRFHQGSTPEDGAALMLNAGMDAEHPGVSTFGKGLDDAVRDHRIPMKVIDTSVSRILRVKFEIGLFDDPFVDPKRAVALANEAAHADLALEAARRSMVLLKNDNHVLPLKSDAKRIVVLGDVANRPTPLGGYSGDPGPRQSFLEGLRAQEPNTRFDFVPGVGISSAGGLPPIPATAIRTPDGQPGLRAEYWNNMEFRGAPSLTRVEATLDHDWDDEAPAAGIDQTRFSARWTGTLTAPSTGEYDLSVTGDDGIRVKIDGKTVAEDWGDHPATTTVARVRLTGGQPVPIVVEYYQNTGQAVAKLGWAPVGAANSLTNDIANQASGADAVIVFGVIREGEGSDRAYLNLPGNQEEAIQAAVSSGAPVVVVLVAGSPVTMEKWGDSVPAVLDAWYPGERGAEAVAETLFGVNNPGGRLPITFPRTVGQCPIYYNLEPSGRGYDYVDSTGKPLFAFGHGLSYTTFKYSNLRIEPGKQKNSFVVTVAITNTGQVAGDEVVQLYTHQRVSSVIRPLEELKDFARIHLAAGETRDVRFDVPATRLAFLNSAMKLVNEPGLIDVMVGAASDDIRVRGELQIRS